MPPKPKKKILPVYDETQWPAWAKTISLTRQEADAGVGDTAQRLFAKVGGEGIKAIAAKLGVPCKCGDRQAAWNLQFPYIGDTVFVTSLSPTNTERQQEVLASWVEFGATIVVVNTSAEIVRLRAMYPQVHHWVENEDEAKWQDRKTQPIVVLANIATLLNRPVYIINSDVEVIGERELLPQPDERLVLGVRWNYTDDRNDATEFQWGFDVLGITPDHARNLPAEFPFGIGQPVWDYAAPLTMAKQYRVVHEPLFYHREHPLNWSDQAWQEGAEYFRRLLGETLDYPTTDQWRQRFEPDMTYNGKRYVRRTDT